MNWRHKVNRRLIVVRASENPGQAANVYYPDLGLAVMRMAVDRLAASTNLDKVGTPIIPNWLEQALAQSSEM
jgi:hypothetical protein